MLELGREACSWFGAVIDRLWFAIILSMSRPARLDRLET